MFTLFNLINVITPSVSVCVTAVRDRKTKRMHIVSLKHSRLYVIIVYYWSCISEVDLRTFLRHALIVKTA